MEIIRPDSKTNKFVYFIKQNRNTEIIPRVELWFSTVFLPSFKSLPVYPSLNIPFTCVLHRHTTDSPLSQLIFFLLCPQSFAAFRFYLYVKRLRKKKKLLNNYSGVVFLDVIVYMNVLNCLHWNVGCMWALFIPKGIDRKKWFQ